MAKTMKKDNGTVGVKDWVKKAPKWAKQRQEKSRRQNFEADFYEKIV